MSTYYTQAHQAAGQIQDNATYLDQMMHHINHGAHIRNQKIMIASLLATLRARHKATQSDIRLMTHSNVEKPVFYGYQEKIEDILAFLVHKTALTTQTPYLFLSVVPTQLIYPGTMTPHDALAFSLTNAVEAPPLKNQYLYKERPAATLSPPYIIADQHYGYFDDLGEVGCVFVLPRDIKKIRPNIQEKLPESLSSQIIIDAKK